MAGYSPEGYSSPRFSEEMEERLKPNRFLGYDRDHIGVTALRRGMLEVAESQFRRAADLNPYEPRFREHLAWSLFRLERFDEALAVIETVLAERPNDADVLAVKAKIDARAKR